ncbi:MAG: CRISPR-associated protein Cas4 [Thermoprotei archaeon]|nr:MAG: CRISPR-associated protein Cas4 [Thermoprotei archaeon]RLF01612.1 MAG: CRISPR-associated protein Cas4 [Thermoprotei archaeon]
MLGPDEKINYVASNAIIKLLYDQMLKEHEDRLSDLKSREVLYVTDLVSCSHKRELRILYPEIYFRFEPTAILGGLAHRGLEQYLIEQGFEVEKEFEIPFELDERIYRIKGRVDARKEDLVVEIKTARSDQGIPHLHHVMQLQVYLVLLDAAQGILIYITPSRLAEYRIDRVEIDLKTLVEETVYDLRHPRWSWECKYCPFSRICAYTT